MNAIRHMHDRNIAHNDLSLQCLKITQNFDLKLSGLEHAALARPVQYIGQMYEQQNPQMLQDVRSAGQMFFQLLFGGHLPYQIDYI